MMMTSCTVETFLILFIVVMGFVGVATAKTIVKTIMCINILEVGVIMLFLSVVYRPEMLPPILPVAAELMVDPTPSALTITAIVIGASVTALALMMSVKIFYHYGTTHWKTITERMDR